MGKAENLDIGRLQGVAFEGGASLRAVLEVTAPIIFDPRFEVTAGAHAVNSDSMHIGWLPRGRYNVRGPLPTGVHAGDKVRFHVTHHASLRRLAGPAMEIAAPQNVGGVSGWSIESIAPTPAVEGLSWRKGHSDWFFRHFDHAATTVVSYLLGDHPSLRGRILDVGCGDGITDLGIALRTRCSELVGIDPFKGFERLPTIIAENHLPADILGACNLRFMAADANFLPFADDSFDALISWGSIEHMAGGYLQALREMKRVLKPDGLIMLHPGLYYSNIGHHLNEFSSEPFFHLRKTREEIRKMVLETPPRYIDRAGEFSSNEQFYQWFTELNPITVTRIEQEMRALDFRPWRVAIRTQDLIEYTPDIEQYPIQDLATTELYSSWISRKKARPGSPDAPLAT
jgi:ubiquinone/menaquinone biosynthesis C-methylase UbiE